VDVCVRIEVDVCVMNDDVVALAIELFLGLLHSPLYDK
jgi:hypothetical protein